MEIVLIIISIIVVALLGYIIFRISKPKKESEGLSMLLTQMNELQRIVDQKLGETHKEMSESLKYQTSRSHELIREITREITEVKKTGEQVVGFTEQLKDLQDILKNPKQRGTILGEYYLETILSRVLPPNTFQTQYLFKNGDKVDAVVFVDKKIIPIDSKFSLENYNRIIDAHKNNNNPEPFVQEFKKDIKNRIDETSKYIRPSENTLDFAFMFIPHESIYYDLLIAEVGKIKINTQDLLEYAFKKKVIIVSPTSFLAYLQTVMQGLRALKIEESAKEIIKRVEELGQHMKSYGEYHDKLGSSLGTVINHYNSSKKEFKKVDKDVLRITGTSTGIEVETPVLDRPISDE